MLVRLEKIQLVADTCSLIFLYRIGLLDLADKFYKFYITRLIYQELGKRANKEEMETYQKSMSLFDLDNVSIKPVNLPNASTADKSLIVLYHAAHAKAVLSEDGIILKYCQKNNIPHFCCLSLVADMARKEIISMKAAKQYLNKLEKYGRYADWVIETAYIMLEDKKKESC